MTVMVFYFESRKKNLSSSL